MNAYIKVLAVLASFAFANSAFAENGFSVGGVGTFGGTAKSPLSENGWPSLQTYRDFRDCCNYENTAEDAALANDALAADNGSTSKIAEASCAGATYPKLKSTCTASGKDCSLIARDTFAPMRDFDRLNACIQPSNYSSFTVYQAAALRSFGLTSADVALFNEAATASSDLSKFCPSMNCGTAQKAQFVAAKNGLTKFQQKRDVHAATSSVAGTLTLADLTDTYGSSSVTLTQPWNLAPYTTWLVAWLNAPENNATDVMRNAASPADWQSKINAVATTSNTEIALWYIKQIADGVTGYPTAALSSQLLSAAGVSSSIYSETVYVTNARSNILAKDSSSIATTSTLTAWLQSLVPPTISPATPLAVDYNIADVSSSGVEVIASLTATTPDLNGATFSISPAVSGFSINASTGRLTTSSAITAGKYTVNVIATDSNSVASAAKVVTVAVNTPPTISLSCGNGQNTVAYSCSSTGADTDGDSLTYSLVGAPSWLSINSSGVLSGTPNAVANNTGIKVRVNDGKTTTDSAAFAINIAPNTANLLANTSSTFTSSDVANLSASGVSSAIVTDLSTNSTCGASGNQSCLAAFNAQKASSSCSLAGGSSATGSQIQAYISCVMIEHHTTVANAVSVPSTSTTTGNSCTVAVNGPVPSTCAHPQWTCTIQGSPTPSGWQVTQSSGLSYASIDLTTSNGAPVTGSYTVRASLGIYTPAYSKDYTYTNVNIPTSPGAAANSLSEYSGGKEHAGFWNYCIDRGKVLATENEIKAHKGWSSLPTGFYLNGNYNPYSGFVVNKTGADKYERFNCNTSSWSTIPFMKTIRSGNSWRNVKMRGWSSGTRLKYTDSNDVVRTDNCRTRSYTTATFFCKGVNYNCN